MSRARVLPLRVPERGRVAVHGVGGTAVLGAGLLAVCLDDFEGDFVAGFFFFRFPSGPGGRALGGAGVGGGGDRYGQPGRDQRTGRQRSRELWFHPAENCKSALGVNCNWMLGCSTILAPFKRGHYCSAWVDRDRSYSHPR